mgnify:FL=1
MQINLGTSLSGLRQPIVAGVVVDPTMSFTSGYSQQTVGFSTTTRYTKSGFNLDASDATTGGILSVAIGSNVTVGDNLQVRGLYLQEVRESDEGDKTFSYDGFLIGYGFGADQSAQQADAKANWGQGAYTTVTITNNDTSTVTTLTLSGSDPIANAGLNSSEITSWQTSTGLGSTARPFYVPYSGVTSTNWVVMGIGWSNTITLS